MRIDRFAIALALLAAGSNPHALFAQGAQDAQGGKAGAAWVTLAGSERKCTRFEQQIGGRICHEWDTAQRSFRLDKDGSAALSAQFGHSDGAGPTREPTVVDRAGRLSQPEIRSFRGLLASVGLASLTAGCNPFGGLFGTVPFQEGATYELVWNGPNGSRVTLPLASGSPACPQRLLRLLHRINLITTGLPDAPNP